MSHIFHQILALKIVQNEKKKTKLPPCMYDNFHAHLVETYLKTQESNMHGKLTVHFPDIITGERYRTSMFREFTSMKSVKDMDSITSWRRLCCFACIMQGVSNHAKEYKNDEKPPEGFQNIFLCSHLSKFLKRNPEDVLQLYSSLQMSIIVIFMSCMIESLLEEKLATVCSVSVHDVPMVLLEFILPIF